MQDNTKKITYGAMMIALFVILLAVTLYAPLIRNISLFFIPLPIILYRLEHNRSSAILVAFVGVMLSLFVGGILIIPIAIIFALLGFVIGDTIQTGKSKLYTFMASGLTLLVSLMASYAISVLLFSFNPITFLLNAMTEMQKAVRANMEKVNVLPPDYDEKITHLLSIYELSIPSTFILATFLFAFILLTLNLAVAHRLGHKTLKMPPLREMKLPVFVVILYGILLLLQLTTKADVASNAYMLQLNATIILQALFLLQGLSFILYYLHEMKVPKVFTILTILFALVLSQFVLLIGILDAGTSLRNFIGTKKPK